MSCTIKLSLIVCNYNTNLTFWYQRYWSFNEDNDKVHNRDGSFCQIVVNLIGDRLAHPEVVSLIERCVFSFCLSVHWLCYFGATNKLRDDRCQLLHRLCTLASMSHSSRSTPKFSYFINAPFNFRFVLSSFYLFALALSCWLC